MSLPVEVSEADAALLLRLDHACRRWRLLLRSMLHRHAHAGYNQARQVIALLLDVRRRLISTVDSLNPSLLSVEHTHLEGSSSYASIREEAFRLLTAVEMITGKVDDHGVNSLGEFP